MEAKPQKVIITQRTPPEKSEITIIVEGGPEMTVSLEDVEIVATYPQLKPRRDFTELGTYRPPISKAKVTIAFDGDW